MEKPLLALTMGDPAGIGPEIILKAHYSREARAAAELIVIGFPEPFLRDADMLNLDINVHTIGHPRERSGDPDTVDLLVPEKDFPCPVSYGAVDPRSGKAAGLCIETSARFALDRRIDAVVTAPINKESLNTGGYDYPGHTEFYRDLTGAPDIGMLITLGDLRVIHVTTHTAIKNVPALVTRERIVRVATLMGDAIRLLGIDRPRIAVSGLNPHAGEAGMFGDEEIEQIIPAVGELRQRGIEATGPLPPDTVFARAYCGEFDGVVAMYHDQGHIALKLAGFRLGTGAREVGGVNSTLGLPIIRTSVDHGTAFDIAGKGVASPRSMVDAIETAAAFVNGKRCRNGIC